MDSAATRLLRFCAALLALLLGLELCARAARPLVHACSNRGLAKLELFARQQGADAVFLGSSRTQDGVAPRLFAAELEARTGRRPRAFNLAFTSTTLASLEEVASRLARAGPGRAPRLVVIELSQPQLSAGPVAWAQPAEPAAASLEDRLADAARRRVALIDERAALIPENLARLPGLLAPPGRLDGSEIHFAEQLAAAFGLWTPADAPGDGWAPPQVAALLPEPGPPEAQALRPAADRLLAVAAALQAAGSAVAFAVPPLSEEAHLYEHDPERSPAFAALAGALARRFPVFDGTRLANPKAAFHDTTHLNPLGRAGWSRGLARALAPIWGGGR